MATQQPPQTPPQTPPQGWPNGAMGKELQQALLPGEQVLIWANGESGCLLAATDQRALVIKKGLLATNQFFARKVNSFPYHQLTSVDLQAGMFGGYVELSAGGMQNRAQLIRAARIAADNVCPFSKSDEKAFRRIVDVMRQRVQDSHQPQAATAAASVGPVGPSIPEQIEQLAKLRDAGILSPEEFEAKKTELLARM